MSLEGAAKATQLAGERPRRRRLRRFRFLDFLDVLLDLSCVVLRAADFYRANALLVRLEGAGAHDVTLSGGAARTPSCKTRVLRSFRRCATRASYVNALLMRLIGWKRRWCSWNSSRAPCLRGFGGRRGCTWRDAVGRRAARAPARVALLARDADLAVLLLQTSKK